MAQTFTNTGFGGETLDGTAFARIMAEGGQPYGPPVSLTTGLADSNALKVTTAAGTLKVSVSAGAVTGWGHRFTNDASLDLTLGAIASGTRWDLIAIRRAWTAGGGLAARAAAIVVIPGTTARALPAARNANPGVLDDQPLALVQVTAGNAVPTAIVSLTSLPSKVHTVSDVLAAPQGIGTLALVGNELWRRDLVASTPTWVSVSDPAWINLPLVSGGQGTSGTIPQYRVANGMVQLRGSLAKTDGSYFAQSSQLFASVPFTFSQRSYFNGVYLLDRGYGITVELNGQMFKTAQEGVLQIRLDGIQFPLR